MSANARGVAWEVLERVERDRAFSDLALHAALRDGELERRDRAFATELVYGTLRLRGRVDVALAQVLDRPLGRLELRLRQLLRLGGYQLLALRDLRAAAVVDESVKLARTGGLERATGLVNAVLRSLARRVELDDLVYPSMAEDPAAHLEQWCSLPGWLAERFLTQLGPAEAKALADVFLEPPPRTLRVAARSDREALRERLGGELTRLAPHGLTHLPRDPVRDPAFERGEISVQDEASQLVPLLLGAGEGDTVVDCCAAPGSKTAQIAEIVGPRGEVIALELHASRLGLIHRSLARTGWRNARVLQRDVRRGFDLQGRARYSRVLVDAPCTGLGTLRRNPDARWRLRPDDVARCAETGLSILESAARYVEPGGVLVYSVCTFTPEETDQLIERFLESHAGFRIDDPRPYLPGDAAKLVDDGGAVRTWPHRDGCDAFFAVRMLAPEKNR